MVIIGAIIFALTLLHHCSAIIDPKWIEPHIWSLTKDSYDNSANDNGVSISDNRFAVQTFYKKLVRYLINSENMDYNSEDNVYRRTITIEVHQPELDTLEHSEDMVEWDKIVTQILYRSKENKESCTSWDPLSSIATAFSIFAHSKDLQFISLILGVFLLVIFLKRRCNWSYIPMIITGIFLVGFMHTYFDCNKNLEIDELINLIDQNDPCEAVLKHKSHWFWSFFSPKMDNCIDHLKTKYKKKMPFCRPDEVLLMYFNDLLFKNCEIFITKANKMLGGIFDRFSFPYNIIAGLTLPLFLYLFCKMNLKYLLGPLLCSYVYSKSKTQTHNSSEEHITHPDRLSGENFRLIMETMKTFSSNALEIDLINKKLPSGVENIETRQLTDALSINEENEEHENKPELLPKQSIQDDEKEQPNNKKNA